MRDMPPSRSSRPTRCQASQEAPCSLPGPPFAAPPRMMIPAPAREACSISASCSRSRAEYGIWKASKTPISICS